MSVKYVLAWNKKEAEELCEFGYDTLAEAKEALKDMKRDKQVDSYYANKYKIFKLGEQI